MVIVAQGSDGNVYDLHRIEHASPPEASGTDAASLAPHVEWLTSTGAVATIEDGATFEVPSVDLVLTKLGELPAKE